MYQNPTINKGVVRNSKGPAGTSNSTRQTLPLKIMFPSLSSADLCQYCLYSEYILGCCTALQQYYFTSTGFRRYSMYWFKSCIIICLKYLLLLPAVNEFAKFAFYSSVIKLSLFTPKHSIKTT